MDEHCSEQFTMRKHVFSRRRFGAFLREGASVYFELEGEALEVLAEIGDTLVHDQTEFPLLEMLWGERRGQGIIVAGHNRRGCPMPQPNDLKRGRGL